MGLTKSSRRYPIEKAVGTESSFRGNGVENITKSQSENALILPARNCSALRYQSEIFSPVLPLTRPHANRSAVGMVLGTRIKIKEKYSAIFCRRLTCCVEALQDLWVSNLRSSSAEPFRHTDSTSSGRGSG